jgi:hypothetical protein
MSPRRSALVAMAFAAAVSTLPVVAAAQQSILQFEGEASEHFGTAVAGLGDTNGDGIPDVAVGAPYASAGGLFSGKVVIVSGADGSVLQRIDGTVAEEFLGGRLAGVGDVDGDGADDVVASALGDPILTGTQPGRAILISGGTGQILWEIAGDGELANVGESLGAAGDVNGDGVPDVLIGAPDTDVGGILRAGRLLVLSGDTGAVLMQRDGTTTSHKLGRSAAGAGDTDGDGVPDVIVGGQGSAHLLRGTDLSIRFTWVGPDTSYGWAVDGGRDATGDGVPDLVVASQGLSSFITGEVELRDGATGAQVWSHVGEKQGDDFGLVVAFVDDGSFDGLADVAVGSRNSVAFGSQGERGRVQVFSGPTGLFVGDLRSHFFDYLGTSVSAIGDVDGDGHGDLVAGAPFYDVTPSGNEGRVLILSTDLYTQGPGPIHELGFGTSGTLGLPNVSFLGDLQPGSNLQLTITSVLTGSTVYVVFGLDWLGAPFMGGVLGPDPELALPFTMPFLGLSIDTVWPPGVPPGLPSWLQLWLPDGGGPQGFAVSHVHKLVAP